ncbi:MAG: CARDB domain-containing protein [Candidatus Aminicenantes bacterium]|jgi:hypothetical protein
MVPNTKKFILIFSLLSLIVGLMAVNVFASSQNPWKRNPANGHYYRVTEPSNWAGAEIQARAWGGHLVTINSSSEETWIINNFDPGGWVGFMLGFNDIKNEGTWRWVSGEPVTYTNWCEHEPNNLGDEDVAFLEHARGNCWNDAHDDPGSCCGIGIAEVVSPCINMTTITGRITDGDSGGNISGATIEIDTLPPVTTDPNGIYNYNNVPVGDHQMSISKNGYNTFYTTVSVSPTICKMTKNYSLYPEGEIRIYSITSKYNGFVHYLTGTDFAVDYIANVDWAGHPPEKVRFITPNGPYDVITQGTTAAQTFNIAADFQPCSTLKAIAISSDGTQSVEKTADFVVMSPILAGLTFDAIDLGDGFYSHKKFQLNMIDRQVAEQVPDNIPLFGGDNAALQFFPDVEATVESNGHVEITLDWNKSVISGNIAGFNYDIDTGIQLGLEGNYLHPGCDYSWSGALGINAGFSAGKSWPYVIMAGPVPIPVYIGATIDLSLDALLTVEDIEPMTLNGSLGIHPYVRGKLGAGADGIFCVEGWIGGGADVIFNFPGANEYTIYLNAGVSATALMFHWETDLLRWDWQLGAASPNPTAQQNFNTLRPKLITRAYLNETQKFNRQMNLIIKDFQQKGDTYLVSSGDLQNSVFPYSEANLSSRDTHMSLVWLEDNPAREPIDRTMAVYSSYNGNGWSVPYPIWDDNTADFHPDSVTFSNGAVMAAWGDEKTAMPANATFNDMVQNLEISAAVYNPATQTWAPLRITNNNYFDAKPKISGNTGSDVMLIWYANEANDIHGSSTAPNKLYFSRYDGANWSNAELAAEIPMGILKYDLLYDGSTGYVVLGLDTDDNLETIDDHELYLLTYENGAWASMTPLTNDTIVDTNPHLVKDLNGNTILSWLKADGLYSAVNFNIAGGTRVIAGDYSTNFSDFQMASSGNGRLALVWAGPYENSSDVFAAFYDPFGSTWGDSRQLTADAETERSITAAFYGNDTLIAVYNQNTIEERQITQSTPTGEPLAITVPEIISTDLYMLKYTWAKDLALEPGSFITEPENPLPGNETILEVKVVNPGEASAENVPVAFYLGNPDSGGTLIGETSIPGIFKPGDEAYVSIQWTVPGSSQPLNVYARVDPDAVFDTDNRQNNTLQIQLVKPDLTISTISWQHISGNLFSVTARVVNQGTSASAATTVKFRHNSNLGPLLSEKTVDGLESKAAVDVSFEWTVPDMNAGNAVLAAIVDEDNVIAESSEENNLKQVILYFDTANSYIIVTNPNGGEIWTTGTTQTIYWFTDNAVENVNIEYSTAGLSGTYIPIAGPIANSGAYEWTIPDVDSSQCVIRVKDEFEAVYDTSDGLFTIAPSPTVTVITPNGGEVWQRGTPQNITWTSQNMVGNVIIQLFQNDSFDREIGTVSVNDENLVWNIPEDLSVGNNYQVRIYQGNIEDRSDDDFSITDHSPFWASPDFDGDGLADVIWRYQGLEGYNAVWLMGTQESAAAAVQTQSYDTQLATPDMKADVSQKRLAETGNKKPRNTQMRFKTDGFKDAKNLDRHTLTFNMDKNQSSEDINRVMLSSVYDPREVPQSVDLIAVADQNWKLCGTGDFNGDNKIDIVWSHVGDGRNCVWYMDSTTYIGYGRLPDGANTDWVLACVGDFNQDSKPDLLWRNEADGRNGVWYMDGTTLLSIGIMTTGANLDWKLCGSGDFNSDNKVDLVWRNTSDGRNAVWYMEGVELSSVGWLMAVENQDWKLRGTGDFNSDGKTDLIWTNISDGRNCIWYLDGVTLTGVEFITTVTNTDWKIEN